MSGPRLYTSPEGRRDASPRSSDWAPKTWNSSSFQNGMSPNPANRMYVPNASTATSTAMAVRDGLLLGDVLLLRNAAFLQTVSADEHRRPPSPREAEPSPRRLEHAPQRRRPVHPVQHHGPEELRPRPVHHEAAAAEHCSNLRGIEQRERPRVPLELLLPGKCRFREAVHASNRRKIDDDTAPRNAARVSEAHPPPGQVRQQTYAHHRVEARCRKWKGGETPDLERNAAVAQVRLETRARSVPGAAEH